MQRERPLKSIGATRSASSSATRSAVTEKRPKKSDACSNLPGPLEARQRIEAEPAGIEQLLRSIFADDIKPVRPELFDRENSDTLNRLIEFILKELGPVKKVALTPRLWITISGTEQIEKRKKEEILQQFPREDEKNC